MEASIDGLGIAMIVFFVVTCILILIVGFTVNKRAEEIMEVLRNRK